MEAMYRLFISNAKDTLRQIKQDIQTLKDKIAPTLDDISRLTKVAEKLEDFLRVAEQREEPQVGRTVSTSRHTAITSAAYTVLQQVGEPLHRGEILKRVEEMGVRVPGKSPVNNLGAQIHRDERFTVVRRGYYALTEWQKPEGATPEPQE